MKKKYWAFGAAAVALVLCTGCGEKAVVDKMYETTIDSASFNMAFDVDVDITAKDPEESTSFNCAMEVDGMVSGITENAFTAKIKGDSAYNYADMDEDSVSFKACYENEVGEAAEKIANFLDEADLEGIEVEEDEAAEDTATETQEVTGETATDAAVATEYPATGNSILYLCDEGDDEWYYESAFDGDIEYLVTLESLDDFKESIKDIVYKSKKKMGSTNIAGEDCYILQKKLSAADGVLLEEAFTNSFLAQYDTESARDELETLFGCELEAYIEAAKPVLNIYVSKNNGYFMGADLDLSKIDVNKYLKAMEYTMQDLADDVGAEGLKSVKVHNALLSLRLEGINATTVTIEDSIRQVYLEDWGDYDGGFVYEYDIEEITDDDEDWEDDDEDWDDEDDEDWEDDEPDVDVDDDFWDADDDDDDEDDWETDELDEDASDAKTVDLYNSAGAVICTIKVPDGVNYYPDYSDPECIDLMDAEWTLDCFVSSTIDQGYASYELEEFLEGPDEDGDFDPTVTYSKEAISISIMGGTAYYMSGNGLEGEEHYIVIPYTSSEGETEYVTVSFDTNHVNGWGRQDYINFANQMFN